MVRCCAAAAAVLLLVLVPTTVEALAEEAYIDGAEAWIASDCSGEVPIVVGSDAKAQSDIYSAITLAGAIGTDCVILAGARGGDMPTAQKRRLEAAESGGYVVGGAAAVAAVKIAGRTMVRIAGDDRWATAQQVGAIASGTDPDDVPEAPSKSGSVKSAGAHIQGAEGWFTSDCAGKMPIVVGSDAKAQSDIYSAITLAGAIGTDCVVLAGARDDDMSAAQQQRLNAAEAGDYVVGGESAVPAAKTAERNIMRIAGADRWITARHVGQQARRFIGEHAKSSKRGQAHTFRSVAVEQSRVCGIRSDDTLACWGDNDLGRSDPPLGRFKSLSLHEYFGCGIRSDDTLACWGGSISPRLDTPLGKFKSIVLGESLPDYHCGIRSNDTLHCWGKDRQGIGEPPSGKFKRVVVAYSYACAIRFDDTLACWGDNRWGQTDVPVGRFRDITLAPLGSGSRAYGCGIRFDDTVVCWGYGINWFDEAPAGKFKRVVVTYSYACAIRFDDTLACWGDNRWGQIDIPIGGFKDIALNRSHVCGIRSDETLICWGAKSDGSDVNWLERERLQRAARLIESVPSGEFKSIVMKKGDSVACGIRSDDTLTCWGYPKTYAAAEVIQLAPYKVVATSGYHRGPNAEFEHSHTCGIRRDDTVACWGYSSDLPPPPGRFKTLAVGFARPSLEDTHTEGSPYGCGIRMDDTIVCWGSHENVQNNVPAGKFKMISIFASNTCAIRSDDTISCWRGDFEPRDARDPYGRDRIYGVPPSGKFKAVGAGYYHACALGINGAITCWGDDREGKTKAPSGKFKAIAVGGFHGCAIRTNDTVTCWDASQLPLGQASPPSGKFKSIAAGIRHTCGIRSDDTLVCWGDLRFELEFWGDNMVSTMPGGKFKSVAAGYEQSCAIGVDGVTVCWGRLKTKSYPAEPQYD